METCRHRGDALTFHVYTLLVKYTPQRGRKPGDPMRQCTSLHREERSLIHLQPESVSMKGGETVFSRVKFHPTKPTLDKTVAELPVSM